MTRASPPCFKWAILSPFFIHLFLSKQNFQQIDVKKCPYSIQCWDSNSQTLEHQSSAITTRPGLLPIPTLIKVPLCLSEENKKQLMCVLFCSQIHSEQFFSAPPDIVHLKAAKMKLQNCSSYLHFLFTHY